MHYQAGSKHHHHSLVERMPAALSAEAAAEDTESRIAGSVVTLAQRIASAQVVYVIALMAIPLFLSQSLQRSNELLRDPDIWWHLANARNLLSHFHFVQVEPFSFTVAGERWINPEWLSELPFWFGYKLFQLRGIYLATWLGLSANLIVLYWRSVVQCGRRSVAFWITAFGFTLMTVNSGPRTIIFAYLAMQVELGILEAAERGNRKWIWLMPPLFCVWGNLHGSWLIGFGLLTLYLVCACFTLQRGRFKQIALVRSERQTLLTVLAASAIALFVNPYGWRLVYNPVDMMLHQNLNIASFLEWQPLNMGSPVGNCALVSIATMLCVNMVRGRRWKLYEFGFILFAWFAAFEHVRFTFLAAVVATPFLARDVNRILPASVSIRPAPIRNAILALTLLWAVFESVPSQAKLERQFANVYPQDLVARVQPDWRTFNSLELGGVMALSGRPNFIDTRVDTFEHHGVFSAYLDTVNVVAPFEKLDRYRIDHLLVRDGTPLVYLLQHTGVWRAIGREGTGRDTYLLLERIGK